MRSRRFISACWRIGVAVNEQPIFKPIKQSMKPSWTPPNWAFPIVWLVIFTFNIFAGWLVWQAAGVAALPALAVYVASLGLNAAWSWLFFGRRRMDLALIDLLALWLSIATVMAMFAQISLLATALLAPYLLWVTIAGFLNLRMIQLNRVTA